MSSGIRDFKDLEVWQLAMDMVDIVYDITEQFPKSEMYSLSDQLRRSAVSVPSNIAEGQQRINKREFAQFLGIARGSLAEVETQLIIALRRKYLPQTSFGGIELLIIRQRKMLCSLINKMGPRNKSSNSKQP